jgi:hypothetical protein
MENVRAVRKSGRDMEIPKDKSSSVISTDFLISYILAAKIIRV